MLLLFSVSPTPDFQLAINDKVGFVLNFLSLSAGNPFFVISSAVLASCALLLKLSYKQLFVLYLQFAVLLVLSFVLKSTVKHATEVARPFTHELVKLDAVPSTQAFYAKGDQQKAKVINTVSGQISNYRISNWQGESNYSFPSGHSIFVAICVVFWAGIFFRHKHYILAATIVTWATGVAFSRYWLGMHWPADILTSIICAALLMLFIPDIKQDKPPVQQ